MKISARLRAVVIAAIDEAGGVSEFARKVGLSPATVSHYRGGQIHSFSDEAWIKIRPVIATYADFSADINEGPDREIACLSVDQQLLLKKYGRLCNEQKIILAEFLDELLLGRHMDNEAPNCLAAEAPGTYKTK